MVVVVVVAAVGALMVVIVSSLQSKVIRRIALVFAAVTVLVVCFFLKFCFSLPRLVVRAANQLHVPLGSGAVQAAGII